MPVWLPRLKRFSRPSDFMEVDERGLPKDGSGTWEIVVEEVIMGEWVKGRLRLGGNAQCVVCGVPIEWHQGEMDKCDDCFHAIGRLDGLGKKSAGKAWKELIEEYRKTGRCG